MARNSQQLQEAIYREKNILAESASAQTRGYARERLSYLRGELFLQKAKEAQTKCDHEWSVLARRQGHETWGCELCGVRR